MPRLFILTILGILSAVTNIGSGFRKTFVASWNLGNRNNWRGKVAPCPGRMSSIQGLFTDHQVYLDKDIATSSITFYQDTEVIFGDSSLVLATERDNSCHGSELESVFENKIPGYWWDPESWQCDSSDILNCNSAIPDLHKVPCRQDTVIVPDETDSLYRMILTNPTPTVAVLIKGKKNMTTSDFYGFYILEEGRQRIRTEALNGEDVNRTPLYIESEGPCTDITGCQCHSNSPFDEICRHQTRKCPRTQCENPVKMEGFCCLMCGVDLAISHNGSLSISTVQSLLKRVLELDGHNVDAYVGKMHDDAFLHVFFMPKDETASFQNAVNSFKNLFEREFNTQQEHSVSVAAAQHFLRKGSSKTTVVVMIILSIIFAIGIFGYVYRKRRLNELPFTFRRMSSGARISMRSRNTSIPSSVHIVAVETSEGRSFVNPTFMSQPEIHLHRADAHFSQGGNQLDLPDIAAMRKPQHERENPLFEIQQDTSISFNALRKMSIDSTDNLKPSASASNANTDEIQHPGKDENEEPSDSATVKEEIIVDVSDNEETLSTDDETDPLEQLAKSRIANIVKSDDKKDDSNIKGDLMTEEKFGEIETFNEESISSLTSEPDQEGI